MNSAGELEVHYKQIGYPNQEFLSLFNRIFYENSRILC
nr:MAG TPA: hypothetical protein [Caudoviricetes sp.]